MGQAQAQHRLAYAARPHQREHALAGQLVLELLEQGPATHHARQRHRQRDRGGHDRRSRPGRLFGLGEKAIPLAMDGLDEARPARAVAQRGAHLRDAPAQHAGADVAVAPDGIEQCIVRDQFALVLHQCHQHGPRPGLE
nr:hypothetical protein [Alkalisalibacterium limincola]